MRPPTHLGPYSDRDIDCEAALEDGLQEIADQAANAGWMRDEIWAALAALAAKIMQADIENNHTDETIANAISNRLRKG